MTDFNAFLSPGVFVRHPEHPDWGTGQVQSCAGHRITVNFPERGKMVIDGNRIALLPVVDPPNRFTKG